MSIQDLFYKPYGGVDSKLTKPAFGYNPQLTKPSFSGMFKPRTQTMPGGQKYVGVTPNVSDKQKLFGTNTPAGLPFTPTSYNSSSNTSNSQINTTSQNTPGLTPPMTYGNYNTSDVSDEEFSYLLNALQSANQNEGDMNMFYRQLDSGNMSMEDMYAMRNDLNKVRNNQVVSQDPFMDRMSPSQVDQLRRSGTTPYDTIRSELDARILRQQELDDQAYNTRLASIKAGGKKSESTGSIGSGEDALTFIDELLVNTKGLKSSVGTTGVGRIGLFNRGDKLDFLGTAQTLIDILAVNTFAEAKAAGLTFGAMSDAEWDIIKNAASKLRAYAKIDTETGKLEGFVAREESIINELERLKEKIESERAKSLTTGSTVISKDSGKVEVISPDGVRGLIPASQLQEALSEGYKQV